MLQVEVELGRGFRSIVVAFAVKVCLYFWAVDGGSG